MGIWYAGVMLYGIELSSSDLSYIVGKIKAITDEDAITEYIDNEGIYELEFPSDLVGASISYSYDGERHYFLAIKTTYHKSEIYKGIQIKDRFEVNYKTFDKILSDFMNKKLKGNWYIMPYGY